MSENNPAYEIYGNASNTQSDSERKPTLWVIIHLFGHSVVAGRLGESGHSSLIRIDVPDDSGYQTKWVGENAIFTMEAVSEEVARAYAHKENQIISYDEPIVPRWQYEEALRTANTRVRALEHQIGELSRRLTTVNALPEPNPEEGDDGLGW